jgi:hypothetical protein
VKLMCEVAECGEELTEGTGSKGGPMMCAACRTSSYYWKKQSLPAMRVRHGKLQLYSHRMEHYDPRVTEIVNAAQKSVVATKKRAKEAQTATKAN